MRTVSRLAVLSFAIMSLAACDDDSLTAPDALGDSTSSIVTVTLTAQSQADTQVGDTAFVTFVHHIVGRSRFLPSDTLMLFLAGDNKIVRISRDSYNPQEYPKTDVSKDYIDVYETWGFLGVTPGTTMAVFVSALDKKQSKAIAVNVFARQTICLDPSARNYRDALPCRYRGLTPGS